VDGDFNSNYHHLQGCLLVCSLFTCNARLNVALASHANSYLGIINPLDQRLLDRLLFFPSSSVSPSIFCVLPVLKNVCLVLALAIVSGAFTPEAARSSDTPLVLQIFILINAIIRKPDRPIFNVQNHNFS